MFEVLSNCSFAYFSTTFDILFFKTITSSSMKSWKLNLHDSFLQNWIELSRKPNWSYIEVSFHYIFIIGTPGISETMWCSVRCVLWGCAPYENALPWGDIIGERQGGLWTILAKLSHHWCAFPSYIWCAVNLQVSQINWVLIILEFMFISVWRYV